MSHNGGQYRVRVLQTLMQIGAWSVLNPFILRRKRHKRYRFDERRFNGINIGCGVWTPPNWLGIDGGVYLLMRYLPDFVIELMRRSKYFHAANNDEVVNYIKNPGSMEILHWDADYGLPFDDATIPGIYSSHFFEHLSWDSGQALLKECRRVLKPGGIIRFCLPNLEHDVRDMKQAIAAYDAGDAGPMQYWVTFPQWIGFTDPFSPHKYQYNPADLKRALEQAGFVDVRHCKHKEGRIPDVVALDRKNGVSFHTEAMKPLA